MKQKRYLSDYSTPGYVVNKTDLRFELTGPAVTLTHTLEVVCHEKFEHLVLDGQGFELKSIRLNDITLTAGQYEITDKQLTLLNPPQRFQLTIQTCLHPRQNTALMGLYETNGLYCTQCEAQGFQRMTYCFDRPDVLSVYTVTIKGHKKNHPVMLSNGNCVEQREVDEQHHQITWHDPHPKPGYLFALVAGQLDRVTDTFTTQSGNVIDLAIYSESAHISQCQYALTSIKKAMRWDEVHYGREYDLQQFNIVAVNDFNFGAMENKGLNIFNAKYILVDPKLATDTDYQLVDTVVAHEYFHNWSGNRVTLRDWFQLSLKEGFTVFREQSFDESMQSAIAHRVGHVKLLREKQFIEDAGPNAHAVRPDSYLTIDNFYTHTVYEKGAELIRMLAGILGKSAFRQACDHYFEHFDGKAVTTEDFLASMQAFSPVDLSRFQHWYEYAGTPQVDITAEYQADTQTFTLHFSQHNPNTPGQANKPPLLIPIRLGLYSTAGERMALHSETLFHDDMILLDQATQSVCFTQVESVPIPSFLHHFSAPIQLSYTYSETQLLILAHCDQDGFARFEAIQRLWVLEIQRLVASIQAQAKLDLKPSLVQLTQYILEEPLQDLSYKALLLNLPSETYVGSHYEVIPLDAIHLAVEFCKTVLGKTHLSRYKQHYAGLQEAYVAEFSPDSVGRRCLKNHMLRMIAYADDTLGLQLAQNQFTDSLGKNMTDCLAALSIIANHDTLERVELLGRFYDTFKAYPLVINKWLHIQASAKLPETVANVDALLCHEGFCLSNPNNVYALLGGLTQNTLHFHRKDGAGYRLITKQVLLLDHINPMVAARVVEPLTQWVKLDGERQQLAKGCLQRILATEGLSDNLYELVHNSIGDSLWQTSNP